MMKLLVTCVVLATMALVVTGFARSQDHLLNVLQAMHNSHTFHSLPTIEKVVLVELLAAAETDTITHYVDRIGFDRVLLFLDHVNRINQTEAHLLEKYLIQELAAEQGPTTQRTTVHVRHGSQRSLQSVIHAISNNQAFLKLSKDDQDLMLDLAEAAEHGNATALVHQVGYSKIIALVEHILSPAETHLFLTYLVNHLAAEMGHHHGHGGAIFG